MATIAAPAPARYPVEREVDIVLRNGRTVHVRPLRADDRDALYDFLAGLSEESRWFRFFSTGINLRSAVRAAVDVDYVDRYGIVALAGREIVAHGCYMLEAPQRAEVAFAVADRFQAHGIATLMLAHLVEAAESAGVATLTASVLPDNHRMIGVFRDSGLPVAVSAAPGVLHVEMPASLSDEARERFADRDRTAAVAAVSHVLAPASVAVVGASERPGSVGGAILANIRGLGYGGRLWAVHPRAREIKGVAAVPSLRDLPAPPELAVVAVPAPAVLGVAQDAAAAGVSALVVVTAGFAESGPDGVERQRALIATCREAGMRLVGPNCLGVLNNAQAVRLDATFAPHLPTPGRVAFMSQSGALGIAMMDAARAQGMGISSFVSAGNKGDLSGNDFLQFWETDPGTDVVLLYLESFGNARKFARVAPRVARRKPIVAVKAGRSAAGLRATASHTGALLAASDAAVDALFAQSGVVRTDTLAELFEVGTLLAKQPPPAGSRVGIVTNGGGLGILCADACESAGLEVVELPGGLQRELAALLPAEAAVGNPVDVLATAPPDTFARAVRVLGRAGAVDGLIVLFVQPFGTDTAAVAAAIEAAAGELTLPVAAVFMSGEGCPCELRDVPCYAFPEEAARAMARAARYGAWRARPLCRPPHFEDLRPDEASALIAQALTRGDGWLTSKEAHGLARCYGIPLPVSREAADPAAAAAAAAELGGPVALKALAPGLVHKSDVGGVRLNLPDPAAVERAAREIAAALGPEVRFLVQQMVPAGRELLVGVVHDPSFGPIVACGAGGTQAEALRDVSVRLTPLSAHEATTMVRELRTFPLLDGFRGAPRDDIEALENVLLRVAALADAHAEVLEIELNPVIVTPAGAVAPDIRVRVHAAPAQPPLSSLRAA